MSSQKPSKPAPKRPAGKAPARPPSVPKPSDAPASARPAPPSKPKRSGPAPVDPVAAAKRKAQLRWVLVGLGLVVILAVLVGANVLLLQTTGRAPAPAGTAATPASDRAKVPDTTAPAPTAASAATTAPTSSTAPAPTGSPTP